MTSPVFIPPLPMSAPRSPRFLLLPGTGADGRLFPADWDRLPGEVIRVDWRDCAGARTLREAAEVLATRYDIRESDTLVGVSLGGMVACEIARLTRVAGLVLVASATHPREIASPWRIIHPLIRIVPLRLCQRIVARSPFLAHRMFSATDAAFIRDMIVAIFRWDGAHDALHPRPLRIHGRGDRVIPAPHDADHLLPGGHMFMMHAPAPCVDMILARQR